MKKRLLITSIVMMLVVAVALSTATYAWFTSNANVTASTVTLTAESNGGAALGIGWLGGTTGTTITSIDPHDSSAEFKPMVPSALTVANGENTPTNYSAVTWSGATIRTAAGGVPTFNQVYSPAPAPYQYSGTVSSSTVDTFYIENLSAQNTIGTITMSLSEVTDVSDLLRVAVFTSTTTGGAGNDYTLKAVLAKTPNAATEFGTVVKDTAVSALCETPVSATTSYVISNLAASGVIYFKVVAWLDGVVLNDVTAGHAATAGLTFMASAS